MKVFGIVGWSGSGCTALMSQLSDYFTHRGLQVSAVKQSAVDEGAGRPPEEVSELHAAGCVETLMVTPRQWYLSHRNFNDGDASLDRVLENMEDVDLVLVEGFKQMCHPKILLVHPKPEHQRENTELLLTACPHVVAMAETKSTKSLPHTQLPMFKTADVHAIASFIKQYCRLPLKAPVIAING